MLRIGFFVCLKNSSIIDDFWGGGVRLENIENLGSLAEIVKFPKLFNHFSFSVQSLKIVRLGGNITQ